MPLVARAQFGCRFRFGSDGVRIETFEEGEKVVRKKIAREGRERKKKFRKPVY